MKNSKLKNQKYCYLIIGCLLFLGLTNTANALTASATAEKPSVAVKINGNKPYPGDALSATPRIMVTVTSTNTVQSILSRLGGSSTALTLVGGSGKFYATQEVASALADGSYCLTIEAADNYNNVTTFEITPLYVRSSGVVTVQGVPLNYPNPFDPGTQSTYLGYNLSKPANVEIKIFDLSGGLVAKRSYASGQPGGNAGYNEAAWDGKSDSGNYVGNGLYLFLIIADGTVAQNGKGKITVFKR
jgi:hypothetical protein